MEYVTRFMKIVLSNGKVIQMFTLQKKYGRASTVFQSFQLL